ncbi:MAG: hypothetical protein ABGZ17_07605, partial [Planctomycetaceae bacterium]
MNGRNIRKTLVLAALAAIADWSLVADRCQGCFMRSPMPVQVWLDHIQVNITDQVPLVSGGSYNLLFITDASNTVFEPGAEGDNMVVAPFTVTADAADLAISTVNAPATVAAG